MKLGVADHLSAAPQTVTELALRSGANEDALYRVLRALATFGVFEETQPRTFALTPAAELLKSGAGLRDMALWMSSPFHFRVYANTLHSVRTGQPAVEETVRMPVFQYLARDQELSEIFNNAMTAFSAMVVPAVLEAYDFSGIETLVDVAGGHGAVLTSVLQHYPHMRGMLMDVDHVIAGAKGRISALNLDGRCETVVGDFFHGVPPGGDAYIMKHIIHDWDDARASAILKNVHRELRGKSHGQGHPARGSDPARERAGPGQADRPRDADDARRPRADGGGVPCALRAEWLRVDTDRADQVAAQRDRGPARLAVVRRPLLRARRPPAAVARR